MHKIIVLNRFFAYSSIYEIKNTSIINCQNKCYIVEMHFEFQNMLTVLK